MHKRLIGIIFCCLITLCATGQIRNRYRVWFSDKANSSYTLESPEEFLSAKAIERRARYNIDITEQDLPISTSYRQKIEELGCSILVTSRWMNTVVIKADSFAIVEQVEQLPFVEKIECVQNEDKNTQRHTKFVNERKLTRATEDENEVLASLYGASWEHINQINLAPLHKDGFRGKGMTIAVLDAGFPYVNTYKHIDFSQIVGTHDFTRKSFTYYCDYDHGTSVLICMAANAPDTYIGTAPEANYWLIVTEDNNRECAIEEDYWVAGVEMADSIGVDIVTSSLGYCQYDDPATSYIIDDLDGQTAFCSRAATIASQKGLLVVTAAGNEHNNSWRKITVPADAQGILTVGSVNSDGTHSSFSSIGYTADGRIKPDVMARGNNTPILHPDNMIGKLSGTSFSTPIMTGAMACLWQAHPEWSVSELIDRVQKGSSQYHTPDSLLGYGIPDIYDIHCKASGVDNTTKSCDNLYIVDGILHLPITSHSATISVYDTCGRRVWHNIHTPHSRKVNLRHIERGVYIVTLSAGNKQMAQKVIL